MPIRMGIPVLKIVVREGGDKLSVLCPRLHFTALLKSISQRLLFRALFSQYLIVVGMYGS